MLKPRGLIERCGSLSCNRGIYLAQINCLPLFFFKPKECKNTPQPVKRYQLRTQTDQLLIGGVNFPFYPLQTIIY